MIIIGSLSFWLCIYCFYAIIWAIKICFLAIPFMIMLTLKLGAIMIAITVGFWTLVGTLVGALIKFVVSLFKK
jgi:hypothetical protein